MSKPVSAFHAVIPKLTLSAACVEAIAKETTIPISIRKDSEIRCMMCAQNIFNKPYTEVSHQPFSKEKEAICSSKCFHAWMQLDGNDPIPKLTQNVNVLYKKRIHTPVKPSIPTQKLNQ